MENTYDVSLPYCAATRESSEFYLTVFLFTFRTQLWGTGDTESLSLKQGDIPQWGTAAKPVRGVSGSAV